MSYPKAKKIAVETIPVIDAGPLRTRKAVSYTHLTLPTNREV